MSAESTTRRRRTARWWKEQYVASHFAEIKSPEMLMGFIELRGLTFTELAEQVSYKRLQSSHKSVSRQMLAYLAKGKMSRCEPDLATAIETVLQVPANTFFNVLPKSHTAGRTDNQDATAA